MNAVGIDVSKGKSTVAILRPGGEVVASPFEVSHNPRELNGLVTLIQAATISPLLCSSERLDCSFPSSTLFS